MKLELVVLLNNLCLKYKIYVLLIFLWRIVIPEIGVSRPKIKFAVFQMNLQTKAAIIVSSDKILCFSESTNTSSKIYVPTNAVIFWNVGFYFSVSKESFNFF